jgi:hypothetical protein
VCGLALQDYGYRREEMQAFIEVTVPQYLRKSNHD